MPVNLNLLTGAMRTQIVQLAREGKSYPEIVVLVGPPADYVTVKTYCQSVGAFSWTHARHYITARLNRLRTAGRRDDRERLISEVKDMVDYLGARLKDMERRIERARSATTLPVDERG
jgi:hypothetical protein